MSDFFSKNHILKCLQALMQIASEAFVKELGLENDNLVRGNVQVRDLPAGTYIMKEESHKVNYYMILICF